MGIRQWVLVGSAALVVFGVMNGACGGTSDSGPRDAGQDVTAADQTAPKDTGADTRDTSVPDSPAGCTADAALTAFAPPDASLADGATSVGICFGCVHSSCGPEVQDCADDCECNNAVLGAFGCVASGQPLATCAGAFTNLPPSSLQVGQALGLCVIAGCRQACAPNLDASFLDSPNDAPSEATVDGAGGD